MVHKPKPDNAKYIGIAVAVLFLAGIGYFIFSMTTTAPWEIPKAATGKVLEAYQFAVDHPNLLRAIPCYCGCSYEGHRHNLDCYFRDDGSVDRHGLTCAICVDETLTTKEMWLAGKNITEIRAYIDNFYNANSAIATPTPLPCTNEEGSICPET